MKITSRRLTEHAITFPYPNGTLDMPAREGEIVVLLSDKKTGHLNCAGGLLRMRAWPYEEAAE